MSSLLMTNQQLLGLILKSITDPLLRPGQFLVLNFQNKLEFYSAYCPTCDRSAVTTCVGVITKDTLKLAAYQTNALFLS